LGEEINEYWQQSILSDEGKNNLRTGVTLIRGDAIDKISNHCQAQGLQDGITGTQTKAWKARKANIKSSSSYVREPRFYRALRIQR
jgi:hypothetical protein